MREQNKTKRWRERMPYSQALNIERSIREIANSPIYRFALGDKRTSSKAGRKGNITKMVQRLLGRLP